VAVTPVQAQGSGVVDGNGNFSFALQGFTPGKSAVFSVILTGPQGVVTIGWGTAGQVIQPASAPTPMTNGGLIIGPITTQGDLQLIVQGSLGVTGSTILATTTGVEGVAGADDDAMAGYSAIPSSVLGSTQTNPSQLLAGQVGSPLVENLGVLVPGSGSHEVFLGTFDVSGYAALLVYGDPPPASQSLWMWFGWSDQVGGSIGYSQLDALNPKFCAVVGCLAGEVTIVLQNADSSSHNMSGLTIIPLVAMPVHPELLIPEAGAPFPVAPTPTTPPATAIISQSLSTPVGATVFTGLFVWPGKAKLSIGSNAGNTVVNWDATLNCTDANGVVTGIARFGQGNVPNPPPIEVELTSGLATLTYNNDGAATTTTRVALIATS
jgi:hypothetical protein